MGDFKKLLREAAIEKARMKDARAEDGYTGRVDALLDRFICEDMEDD